MLTWWWAVMDCRGPSRRSGPSSFSRRTFRSIDMRTANVILGWLSCLLLSSSASGQARAVPFPPGQGRGNEGQGTRGLVTPFDGSGVLAIEPLEVARPVKGAPYTAEG